MPRKTLAQIDAEQDADQLRIDALEGIVKDLQADVARLAGAQDKIDKRIEDLIDMLHFLERNPGWCIDDYLHGVTRA